MTPFLEIIKAVIFGVVEGITEWLPVSSTGHLILLDEFLKLNISHGLGETFADEYMSMFEVVIQLGAILAVTVMFFGKLNPFSTKKNVVERKSTLWLWLKVCVASVPAAFVGVVGDKVLEKVTGRDVDGWIFNAVTVALALIIYGVLFIVIERLCRDKKSSVDAVEMRLSGLNHLLKYPEYSDSQQFGQLLGTLENQDEILDLVSDTENDDINVLIGSESPVKVMNNSSLVFKPIKKNGRTVGVIGVLGPRRMNYKQVLQAIEEITGSIAGMLDGENHVKHEPAKITGKEEDHGG